MGRGLSADGVRPGVMRLSSCQSTVRPLCRRVVNSMRLSGASERWTLADQAILLTIADLSIELHVAAELVEAVHQRYRGFVRSPSLGVSTRLIQLFASEQAASTPEVTDRLLRVDAVLFDDTHIVIEGDCSGHL